MNKIPFSYNKLNKHNVIIDSIKLYISENGIFTSNRKCKLYFNSSTEFIFTYNYILINYINIDITNFSILDNYVIINKNNNILKIQLIHWDIFKKLLNILYNKQNTILKQNAYYNYLKNPVRSELDNWLLAEQYLFEYLFIF